MAVYVMKTNGEGRKKRLEGLMWLVGVYYR
jgi:hypothetical protein